MDTKITVDCNAEFSTELILAVPYAYYLHKNNLLEKTISTIDSKALYFFSEHHEEKYTSRTISNDCLNSLPNNWLHHNPKVSNGYPGVLDYSQWIAPPFKEYYTNSIFVFPKPLLVISNKYSAEWGEPPINFLDIPILEYLFTKLKSRYTLIYKRPSHGDFAHDENEEIKVDTISGYTQDGLFVTDYELCDKLGVLNFSTLKQQYSNLSYNTFQFLLFANCDYYITVQGGNSTLCSTFGKVNLNYIKRGKEMRAGYVTNVNSWYFKMNNCNTYQVNTYDQLIDAVERYYGF